MKYFLRADSAVPVLNKGTSPVLGFQKFSLWYRDHCGVLLSLIFGLFGSDMADDVINEKLVDGSGLLVVTKIA